MSTTTWQLIYLINLFNFNVRNCFNYDASPGKWDAASISPLFSKNATAARWLVWHWWWFNVNTSTFYALFFFLFSFQIPAPANVPPSTDPAAGEDTPRWTHSRPRRLGATRKTANPSRPGKPILLSPAKQQQLLFETCETTSNGRNLGLEWGLLFRGDWSGRGVAWYFTETSIHYEIVLNCLFLLFPALNVLNIMKFEL